MSPSAILPENVSHDTVHVLSEPLCAMQSITPLVSLLAMTYNSRPAGSRPGGHAGDRLSSLMHTMSSRVTPSLKHKQGKFQSHEALRNSFVRLLSPVLNGMAGLQDFEDAVGASSNPEDFRDFWTLEGHNLIRDWVKDGGLAGTSPGADMVFLDTFVGDHSCRVALGRDARALVLVSGDTRVGDSMVLKAVGDEDTRVFCEMSLA